MPLYTFNLCKLDGLSVTFDFKELATDSDAFTEAGKMLDQHISCDHVEIWDGDRPVVGRHRFQPVIRAVPVRSTAAV